MEGTICPGGVIKVDALKIYCVRRAPNASGQKNSPHSSMGLKCWKYNMIRELDREQLMYVFQQLINQYKKDGQ